MYTGWVFLSWDFEISQEISTHRTKEMSTIKNFYFLGGNATQQKFIPQPGKFSN